MGTSRGGPYRWSDEHLRYLREYVAIFLEHAGPPPWPCSRCGQPVTHVIDSDGIVHHVDEDPMNAAPENLTATHRSCHTTEHNEGRPPSDRAAAALAAGRSVRKVPDGDRDDIRRRYANGECQQALAAEYGIAQSSVSAILKEHT